MGRRHGTFSLTLLSLSFLLVLGACGVSEDPDQEGSNDPSLSLAVRSPIDMYPGESVDLMWALARQQSGPVANETVEFSLITTSTDHGCSMSQQSDTTDDGGLARTTFTAGDSPVAVPIQVMGVVTSIESEPPLSAIFSINVLEDLRVLRPHPADRTNIDGILDTPVFLSVRASAAENRPIADELISWDIISGGVDIQLDALSSQTDNRGIAEIRATCGSAASSSVVEASMEGTAPVEFTVNCNEGTPCSGTNPCPTGMDCIDGFCVVGDPECTGDVEGECGEGRRCRFGQCVAAADAGDSCKYDSDCDGDETCVAGSCTGCEGTDCPCETIDECPEGFDCADGVCVCEGPDCGGDPCTETVVHPDLTGIWDVESDLHLREALPDWLDGLLGAVGDVFRFLSDGMIDGFDFDIPFIGDALEAIVDGLVDEYVPPWVGDIMRAIADINDILSSITVYQEMNLWPAGAEDQYLGTMNWLEVEMEWRGDTIRDRMVNITGIDVYAADGIEGEAICGTFYVHRHDVMLSYGLMITWLLDMVVTLATGGEYFTLEELLDDLIYDICEGIAYAIDEAAWGLSESLDIDLPDVYGIAYGVCELGLEVAIDSALSYLDSVTVTDDAVTMAGYSTITSGTRMDDGHWLGTLIGADFSGEWTADR